jgi:hypothetical protein
MSEGKSAPFDVPLNKLVPAIVGNSSIIISAGAQMDDVLNAGSLCYVEKVFALAQHVDGIARDHEDALNPIQRGRYRFWLIQIEGHGRNTQATCFVGGTSSRYYLHGRIGSQVWDDGSAYLASGSHDENLWFIVRHRNRSYLVWVVVWVAL